MAEITIANIRDFIVNGKLCLPENAVYVGREVRRYGLKASPLANPWKAGEKPYPQAAEVFTREDAVETYREYLALRPSKRQDRFGEYATCAEGQELDRLTELVRKGPLVLVCWCAPKLCHAEVIRDCIMEQLKSDG